MFLFPVNTRGEINPMIYLVKLLKGHLHYKTILCHKVAFDVYLMNFFIWRKNNASFSRYGDFSIFVKLADFKICDVMTSIAT